MSAYDIYVVLLTNFHTITFEPSSEYQSRGAVPYQLNMQIEQTDHSTAWAEYAEKSNKSLYTHVYSPNNIVKEEYVQV